jgi:phosphohistidine phosphatase
MNIIYLCKKKKMKTLIIVRHAKSDWNHLQQKDFDRDLNERGMRDAPMMGKRLLNRHIQVNLLVSSTAKRAAKTAKLIANELRYASTEIQWEDSLYHAPPSMIQAAIFGVSNHINTLMIVCHNPGITDFVNLLTNNLIENMPTCGMCALQFPIEKWEDLPIAKAQLLFYDFPKNNV